MKPTLATVLAASMVLFGVLGTANDAQAISVYGSWWNSKDLDSGWGLGAKHRISIIPIVSGELRASWVAFDKDGFKQNMFPLEAAGRAKLGLMYGGGGVGYYIFSGDDPSRDNTFGGFLMGGYEFALAGLGGFAELKYSWVEADVDGFDAKTDFSGLGINVGVIFDWI